MAASRLSTRASAMETALTHRVFELSLWPAVGGVYREATMSGPRHPPPSGNVGSIAGLPKSGDGWRFMSTRSKGKTIAFLVGRRPSARHCDQAISYRPRRRALAGAPPTAAGASGDK